MSHRGALHRPKTSGQDESRHFKLVVLGETYVGKSSLALRFASRTFHQCDAGMGGAFLKKGTVSLDNSTVIFEIWDTAGQERFRCIAPMYYRGAQAAIVVYDITDRESLCCAKAWIKTLHKQASPNIVIALVGNKADLAGRRMVDYKEVHTYAKENSLLFMETSAKTNINVSDVFLAIAKKLTTSTSNTNGISLSSHQSIEGASKCCK